MILRRDTYGIFSRRMFGQAGDPVTVISRSPRVKGGEVLVVEGKGGLRFSINDSDVIEVGGAVTTEPVIRIIETVPGRKQRKSGLVPITPQQSLF